MTMESRPRWFALYTLTLASLMIVLDATIVNVALPSIRQDLGFSQTSLAWVVNAYLLTYGGFLLLGGVLTDLLNWHWIFLVNFPIGVLVVLLSLRLLPATQGSVAAGGRLDVAGAVTVTGALMLAVYAIVNGNQAGWDSAQTLGLLGGSLALFAVFLWLETHVAAPLVPLGLFRLRNVAVANVVGVLWAAAMFAWFFLAALYLQLVLGYSPLQVGLSFLPANLIMGTFSLGLSAKIVMRYGFRLPLGIGLGLAGIGLALFVRAPVGGSFLVEELLRGAPQPLLVTPLTEEPARAAEWLERFEGVVAKHADLRYEPGRRAMVKVKRERTADCVLAGFRWLVHRPVPGL